MSTSRRLAGVNVKVLVILLAVVVVLTGGAFVGHRVRKQMIASNALNAGRAALDKAEYPEACTQLKTYLSKKPDDIEILERYAQANLAIEPREPERVAAAIGAYRRLLRLEPSNDAVFHKLVRLYMGVGNTNEAAYLCRQRLGVHPEDSFAMLWLARTQVVDRKPKEAADTLIKLVETHPNVVSAYAMLSSLSLENDTPEAKREATDWVERCVTNNPQAGESYAHRARVRRVVNAATSEMHSQCAADLERAVELPFADPVTRLLVAEEWMAWNEMDRARATIDATGSISEADLAESDVEEATFQLIRFNSEARLALLGAEPSTCSTLADRALNVLTEHRRTMFQPMAIQLYLRAGQTTSARKSFEEYQQEIAKLRGTTVDERLTILQAMVLSSEKKFTQVIETLEAVGTDFHDALGWKLLAESYRETGQAQRAGEALQRYASRVPTDQEALIELAKLHRGVDWKRTAEFARAATAIKPTALARLLELEAEWKLGDGAADSAAIRERIVIALGELKRSTPQSTGPRLLLSSVLRSEGKTDAAERELRDAITETTDKLSAKLQLVEFLASNKRLDDARAECEQFIKEHPESAEPVIRLAELQAKSGDKDAARATLDGAAKKLAGTARRDARFAMGQFLLTDGDAAGARKALESLAGDHADDLESRLLLLSFPEVRKDRAAAERLIAEVKQLEGERGVRWKLYRAMYLFDDSNWNAFRSEIEALFEECIRAEPNNETALLAMALLKERTGESSEAEQLYRTALRHHPDSTEVTSRLARLLSKQGRLAEAVALAGGAASGGETRVAVLIAQGQFDAAIRELEMTIAGDESAIGPRIQLAKLVFSHRKDRQSAYRLLEQVATQSPHEPEALRLRVSLLMDEAKNAEAEALLTSAVAAKGDFASLLLRAEFFAASGNVQRAEADYRRLIELPQVSPDAFSRFVRFLEDQQRRDEAVATCEKGLAANPSDAGLQHAHVRMLLDAKDTAQKERGRALLKQLRASNPENPEWLRLTAALAAADGDTGAMGMAREALDRAVAKNPRDVGLQLKRIALMRESGDQEQARSVAAAAVSANPASVDLRIAQVELEAQEGGIAIARGLAQTLASEDPKDITRLVRLSSVFATVSEYELALEYAKKARQLSPTDESATIALAVAMERQGDPRGAIGLLNEFCRSESGRKSLGAHQQLASVLTKTGDFSEAERMIAAAESLTTDADTVLPDRLRWLAAQQRYPEISSLISQYNDDRPEHVGLLLVAGSLMIESGANAQVREGRMWLESAVRLAPRRIDARLGVAQAAYRMGDIDGAIAAYREILAEVNPNHVQSLNDLAWILAMDRGQFVEAEQLATRGLTMYPRDVHLLDTRGAVRAKLNKLDEAREDLERCIALSANNPGTRVRALLKLLGVLKALRSDDRTIQSTIEQIERLDREQKILTDAERVEFAALKGA